MVDIGEESYISINNAIVFVASCDCDRTFVTRLYTNAPEKLSASGTPSNQKFIECLSMYLLYIASILPITDLSTITGRTCPVMFFVAGVPDTIISHCHHIHGNFFSHYHIGNGVEPYSHQLIIAQGPPAPERARLYTPTRILKEFSGLLGLLSNSSLSPQPLLITPHSLCLTHS
jgi:hypothetical protein